MDQIQIIDIDRLTPEEIDLSKYQDQALWSPAGIKFGSNLFATHFMSNFNTRKSYNLGSGLVTNTGVIYMAQSFTGGSDSISAFNFHDSGTGTVGASVGDTRLSTTAGIPGRATGTQTCPTTAQYRTVGTQTYNVGTLAITEWGLFNQSATGGSTSGGILWDRKQFAAINVANGDSIQFTYTLSVLSGG